MKRVILSVLIVISLVAGSIICHADNVANQPSTTSKLTVGIVDFSGYDTHTAQLKDSEAELKKVLPRRTIRMLTQSTV